MSSCIAGIPVLSRIAASSAVRADQLCRDLGFVIAKVTGSWASPKRALATSCFTMPSRLAPTYGGVLGRHKHGRGLGKDDGCGAVALQQFNVALDPSFAALDLCRRGAQHQEAVGGHGLAVVNIEVGRDANIVRQRAEAAARQPLVQHGRDEAAVDDARVAAQLGTDVRHADERLAAVLGPGEGWHDHLAGPEQRATRQRVLPVRRRHLHVRPRLGHLGPRTQLDHQRVRVDGRLDALRGLVAVGCGVRRRPPVAVLVRVEPHAGLRHDLPGGGCAERREYESVERDFAARVASRRRARRRSGFRRSWGASRICLLAERSTGRGRCVREGEIDIALHLGRLFSTILTRKLRLLLTGRGAGLYGIASSRAAVPDCGSSRSLRESSAGLGNSLAKHADDRGGSDDGDNVGERADETIVKPSKLYAYLSSRQPFFLSGKLTEAGRNILGRSDFLLPGPTALIGLVQGICLRLIRTL